MGEKMEKKIKRKNHYHIYFSLSPARPHTNNFIKNLKNDDDYEMANRKEKYEYYTNANEK